jgi:hypothetical protein
MPQEKERKSAVDNKSGISLPQKKKTNVAFLAGPQRGGATPQVPRTEQVGGQSLGPPRCRHRDRWQLQGAPVPPCLYSNGVLTKVIGIKFCLLCFFNF